MTQPRYDAAADAYEAMYGDAVDDPATAGLLDLVDDVRGKRVLDVPCGSGRVARELARRGAQVVGVDISTALLDRGRGREAAEPFGIEYVEADATSPGTQQGEVFDVVVSNFGLSDVDDLDALLANVTRLVRPEGVFVFSILHPCFPGVPGAASPSWPPGGYHDERFWYADGPTSDLRRRVGSNHRTLTTYLTRFLAHGLVLEALTEPLPPPEIPVDLAPGPMFLAASLRRAARN